MARTLPRRLEGRHPNDGLVQLWRFRWVIAAVLVAAVVVLFFVAQGLETQTLESGKREVELMRRDPIARFRAPGTTLRHAEEHPAQRDAFGGGQTISMIEQTFEMSGEPGNTVAAYRGAAEANGWTFVADGCSRTDGATGAVFGKALDGFRATLALSARLGAERAPAGVNEGPRRPELHLEMEATEANLSALPVDAGLHRSDLHCLQGLDPSDPAFQPPRAAPLSLGQLCPRLRAGATAVDPEVQQAQLAGTGREECWLVDSRGFPLFIVERAERPRSYYEDRQVPEPGASSEMYVFSAYGKRNPDLARSVWVATTEGDYVVEAGGVLGTGREAEEKLLAVAPLIAQNGG